MEDPDTPVNPDEPEITKADLKEIYDECVAYYEEENHSEEAWRAYQKALAIVEEVLANEEATEEGVHFALLLFVIYVL